MGYRLRLGKMPKSAHDKYKGKTYEEVEEILGDGNGTYHPPEYTELYQIGKYVDYSKGTKPFYDFDVEEACEHEFFIMSKEQLKGVIQDYHKSTYEYYCELEASPDEQEGHILRRKREWDPNILMGCVPYYLDEEKTDGEIASSWLKEYAIFNIVYIYRNFDWENDYLIYSGW